MENKDKFKINFINLKLKDEIVKPIVKIDRKNIVTWGSKNDYPDYIIDIFNTKSAIHNKIISRKVSMMSMNGIEYDMNDSIINEFLDNRYNDEDIQTIIQNCSWDLALSNSFYLGVRWSLDGTYITEIKYFPWDKCRISSDKQYILVSDNWKSSKSKVNYYPIFSRINNLDKLQIFRYVAKTPGSEYYPHIPYAPILKVLDTEGRIDNFHYNNLKKGFTGNYAVVFKSGEASYEERLWVQEQFNEQYAGDEGGGVVFLFSKTPEDAPELIPLPPNGSDDLYLILDTRNRSKILSMHGVTNPLIFGIETPGKLGGENDLTQALIEYNRLEIEPLQMVLEKVFNNFIKINGSTNEIKLNSFKFSDDLNDNNKNNIIEDEL